jgi:hypothetical protein
LRQQQRSYYHGAPPGGRRRARAPGGNYKVAGTQKPGARTSPSIDSGPAAPHDPTEETYDVYLRRATLSPWVPVPEVVARRGLDLASFRPGETVHADLGSGDGRVCFLAVDHYGARRSWGVDVDPAVLRLARDRLGRRHPPPSNLEFVEGDLLDPSCPAWDLLFPPLSGGGGGGINSESGGEEGVSVLTLHFATPALERLRPLLELKLVGRSCKIVAFGYEVPGWGDPAATEVVLGTQIHLYEWGGARNNASASDQGTAAGEDEDEHEHEDALGFTDPGLQLRSSGGSARSRPGAAAAAAAAACAAGGAAAALEGSTVVDRTGRYPIRGYNPDIFDQVERDTDDEDEAEDEDGRDSDGDDKNDEDDDENLQDSNVKASEDGGRPKP